MTLFKLYSILKEDYKILKLIFFITASFLIIDLFYEFLVAKPTYTSVGKRDINVEDFPEITLCPEKPINLNAANSNGYLDLDTVLTGLSERPPLTHVALTGRAAPLGLIERADLVSEMKLVRHPFLEQGIRAQPGIEY